MRLRHLAAAQLPGRESGLPAVLSGGVSLKVKLIKAYRSWLRLCVVLAPCTRALLGGAPMAVFLCADSGFGPRLTLQLDRADSGSGRGLGCWLLL